MRAAAALSREPPLQPLHTRNPFELMQISGTVGFYTDPRNGEQVGYALTPGYETYAGMGWYGVIVQNAPTHKA